MTGFPASVPRGWEFIALFLEMLSGSEPGTFCGSWSHPPVRPPLLLLIPPLLLFMVSYNSGEGQKGSFWPGPTHCTGATQRNIWILLQCWRPPPPILTAAPLASVKGPETHGNEGGSMADLMTPA